MTISRQGYFNASKPTLNDLVTLNKHTTNSSFTLLVKCLFSGKVNKEVDYWKKNLPTKKSINY